MNGSPSEVSLYVLAIEPLLNRFILDKRFAELEQQRAKWEKERPEREKNDNQTILHARMLAYVARLPRTNAAEWSVDELEAMVKESQPPRPATSLDNFFSVVPHQVLTNLHIASEKIPQCARAIRRLKGKSWYLTKEVRTFSSEEMQDLEFEPAIPVLTEALRTPAGPFAAPALARFSAISMPILVSACQSTNAAVRFSASFALSWMQSGQLAEALLALLKDPAPVVRFNAVHVSGRNWDPRFVEPLIALFQDPYPEVREAAGSALWSSQRTLASSDKERYEKNRLVYLKLLKDPHPDVQECALQVLATLRTNEVSRQDRLSLLSNPRMSAIRRVLESFRHERNWDLASEEVVPLLSHNLTEARVMGLRVLESIADRKAIELALPLLRDPKSIVRKRAYFFLRTVAGEDISPDDPAMGAMVGGQQG